MKAHALKVPVRSADVKGHVGLGPASASLYDFLFQASGWRNFFASTAVCFMPHGTQWDSGCGIDVPHESEEELRAFDQAFAASLDG